MMAALLELPRIILFTVVSLPRCCYFFLLQFYARNIIPVYFPRTKLNLNVQLSNAEQPTSPANGVVQNLHGEC